MTLLGLGRSHAIYRDGYGCTLDHGTVAELALPPESNIVCYRHRPLDLLGPALDQHNRALRERVAKDGTFYIVGTQLPEGYYLRSTLMNPLTESSDLDALIEHLRLLCRA